MTDKTTLLQYLKKQFGDRKVKVVKWKWTKEQLKQLERENKK
jgi:hypothetical protein